MLLKIAASLNNGKAVHNKNNLKLLKDEGDFLSKILENLSRTETKSFHGPGLPSLDMPSDIYRLNIVGNCWRHIVLQGLSCLPIFPMERPPWRHCRTFCIRCMQQDPIL